MLNHFLFGHSGRVMLSCPNAAIAASLLVIATHARPSPDALCRRLEQHHISNGPEATGTVHDGMNDWRWSQWQRLISL
jgi:uncharacterized protein involved in response to NO